jgi:preprotein translocase subunit SecF
MRPLFKIVPDNTNIDFMRWRLPAIGFSVLLVLASLGAIVTMGFNWGVDFVGGKSFHVVMTEPVPIDELRSTVNGLNLGEATIQQFGSPREFSVRLPLPPGDDAAAATQVERVRDAITAAHPGARFDSVETVSGKVSQELAQDGALALLIAMLGISLYIWFRFEWQFGVGALVSLIHDMIVTLGFFAVTQIEFSLNVVAALLTLIGYSLNDTVVVYDRVRENLRKYRKMEIEPLLNLSVNETLSRTIATNGAVLLAVIGLVVIGPQSIFGLTVGILFGVIIGTYSSIYVARFVLVPLGVGPDSFVPLDTAGEGKMVKKAVVDDNSGAVV